jgi:hypothetical protein
MGGNDQYTCVPDDPVQHYVPQSPYYQTQGQPPPERKGMSTAMGVILIIVVLVVIGILGLAFMYSLVSDLGDPWEDTRRFQDDVYIKEDGHFRVLLSDSWEDELVVNLTIGLLNGSRYDVYIMNSFQYENAYGNTSTGAFSSLFEWQNVTSVTDSITLEMPQDVVYLVVDNEDMPHVPGSAAPEDTIHVELDLEITSRYEVDV